MKATVTVEVDFEKYDGNLPKNKNEWINFFNCHLLNINPIMGYDPDYDDLPEEDEDDGYEPMLIKINEIGVTNVKFNLNY